MHLTWKILAALAVTAGAGAARAAPDEGGGAQPTSAIAEAGCAAHDAAACRRAHDLLLQSGEPVRARDAARRGCELDDAASCFLAAGPSWLQWDADDTWIDRGERYGFFLRACDLGQLYPCLFVSRPSHEEKQQREEKWAREKERLLRVAAERCAAGSGEGCFYQAIAEGKQKEAAKSAESLARACSLEFAPACARLADQKPGDERRKRACDLGDAKSCHTIAHAASGDEEIALLERSCRRGDAVACDEAGVKLARQAKAPPGAALLHHRVACDLGYAPGCEHAGDAAKQGTGAMKPDPSAALALYERACRVRAGACDKWTALVADGAPPQLLADPARALSANVARCSNDLDACARAVALLVTGREQLPADPRRAAAVWEDACEAGNAGACSRGAELWLGGAKGLPPQPARSAALLKKACGKQQDAGTPCTPATLPAAATLQEHLAKSPTRELLLGMLLDHARVTAPDVHAKLTAELPRLRVREVKQLHCEIEIGTESCAARPPAVDGAPAEVWIWHDPRAAIEGIETGAALGFVYGLFRGFEPADKAARSAQALLAYALTGDEPVPEHAAGPGAPTSPSIAFSEYLELHAADVEGVAAALTLLYLEKKDPALHARLVQQLARVRVREVPALSCPRGVIWSWRGDCSLAQRSSSGAEITVARSASGEESVAWAILYGALRGLEPEERAYRIWDDLFTEFNEVLAKGLAKKRAKQREDEESTGL